MKATESLWYFHKLLFIMLYKVVLTLNSVDEITETCVAIQKKATQQYCGIYLKFSVL